MDVKYKLIIDIFTHPYIDKKGWIFKADVDWSKAEIEIDDDNDSYIIWHNGAWKDGWWYGGKWEYGVWEKGTWHIGSWHNGVWHNGVWEKGYWDNGIWYDGLWKDGYWYNGIWQNGVWVKGKIYNPKTNQYEFSELPPSKCKWSLSYGR